MSHGHSFSYYTLTYVDEVEQSRGTEQQNTLPAVQIYMYYVYIYTYIIYVYIQYMYIYVAMDTEVSSVTLFLIRSPVERMSSSLYILIIQLIKKGGDSILFIKIK